MEFNTTLRGTTVTVYITSYLPPELVDNTSPGDEGWVDFEVYDTESGEELTLTDDEIMKLEVEAFNNIEDEVDRMAGYYEQGELWA